MQGKTVVMGLPGCTILPTVVSSCNESFICTGRGRRGAEHTVAHCTTTRAAVLFEELDCTDEGSTCIVR